MLECASLQWILFCVNSCIVCFLESGKHRSISNNLSMKACDGVTLKLKRYRLNFNWKKWENGTQQLTIKTEANVVLYFIQSFDFQFQSKNRHPKLYHLCKLFDSTIVSLSEIFWHFSTFYLTAILSWWHSFDRTNWKLRRFTVISFDIAYQVVVVFMVSVSISFW